MLKNAVKNPVLILLLILSMLPALVYGEQTPVVGAIFGLSGSVARYGDWARRGVEIGLDEINKSGAVHGQQLSVRFEDNQGQPSGAVSAFNGLFHTNGIKFFLTYQSSIALAVAPLANRTHSLQMDVSAFTSAYSTPDDYTFRTGVLASALSASMAKELFERLGVKRVGILYIENDKGEAGFQEFKKSYRGEVVFAEAFKPNEGDFKALLLKIRSAGVDDIFLSSHLVESGTFLKQARQQGLKLRVYSDVYSVEGPDFLAAAGGAAEGVVYSTPFFERGTGNTRADSFAREYLQRYSEDPTYFSAQAFDGLIALAEAMRLCETITPDCVRQKLQVLDLEGASGPIRFDRNGDVTNKPIGLKIVRSGRFVNFKPEA